MARQRERPTMYLANMDIKTVFHVENQNVPAEIGAVFEDVESQFQDVPATGSVKAPRLWLKIEVWNVEE